jgi:hypothetical protein
MQSFDYPTDFINIHCNVSMTFQPQYGGSSCSGAVLCLHHFTTHEARNPEFYECIYFKLVDYTDNSANIIN